MESKTKRGRPAKADKKTPFNRKISIEAQTAIKAIAFLRGISDAAAMEEAVLHYLGSIRAASLMKGGTK